MFFYLKKLKKIHNQINSDYYKTSNFFKINLIFLLISFSNDLWYYFCVIHKKNIKVIEVKDDKQIKQIYNNITILEHLDKIENLSMSK